MTLILSAIGRETIWLLADRRLTRRGVSIKEDARKVLFLEATDGVAILGYAGLGATTPHGTEPSDWMSAVLRGRRRTVVQSMRALADAMTRNLLPHLPVSQRVHTVLAPAYLEGVARLLVIELTNEGKFRVARVVAPGSDGEATNATPCLVVAGSGQEELRLRRASWVRELRRRMAWCDQGRIAHLEVAKHMAGLCKSVSKVDKHVGPRCIVGWRNRLAGVHNGGGGHQRFGEDGRMQQDAKPLFPSIKGGMDMAGIADVLLSHMGARSVRPLDEALAEVPDEPDETLR